MRALVLCIFLTGCASFEQWTQSPEPPCDPKYEVCEKELIVVELPLEELQQQCGLWSGTSGCVWGPHKFILAKPTTI